MNGLNLGFAIDLIDRASFKANKIKGSFNDLLASVTKTKRGMQDAGQSTRFFSSMADRTKHSIDTLRTKLMGLDNTGARLSRTFHRFRGILAAIGIAGLGYMVSGQLKSIYMEGERVESQITQLETTLKSKTEAFKMLAWAQREAIKTPFEIPEINDAIVMLKAYNLDAKRYFTMIGNMAAGMNQSLDAGVYAFARATLGNYEAIERFGINKRFVHEKATEMFGAGAVSVLSGAQVTIKDYDRFLQALMAIMNERFEGGMLRLSKSMVGIKSNISDFIGNVKREIIGLPVEGTLYTQIKSTYESVLDMMQRNEKQFSALARVIQHALKIAWGYVDRFIGGLVNWSETFLQTTFNVSMGVDNTVYPLITKMEIMRIRFESIMGAFAKGFKEGFSEFFNVVKTATGPVFDLVKGLLGFNDMEPDRVEKTAYWIGKIGAYIIAFKMVSMVGSLVWWIARLTILGPAVKYLGIAFTFLGRSIAFLFGTWAGLGILAVTAIVYAMDKIGGLRATIESIKGALQVGWVWIEWFGKSVWKVFENIGKGVANFGIVVSNVFSAVWEIVKDIGGRLLKFAAGSVRLWTSILSGDWEGAKSALSEEFNAVFGNWGSTFENVRSRLLSGTYAIDWNFGYDEALKKSDQAWNYAMMMREKREKEYEKNKAEAGGGVLSSLSAMGKDVGAEWKANWKGAPGSEGGVGLGGETYQFTEGAIQIVMPSTFDISQMGEFVEKLYQEIKKKVREEKTR